MERLDKVIKNDSPNLVEKFAEKFDENLALKFTAQKIAFKIFYELKRRKLTQQYLAKSLRVTPQNISKILKGDDYKVSTLIKIEEALAINLIDRDIFNPNNNISIIIHIKTFELQSKPLVVQTTSFIFKSNFQPSTNELRSQVPQSESVDTLINEYF